MYPLVIKDKVSNLLLIYYYYYYYFDMVIGENLIILEIIKRVACKILMFMSFLLVTPKIVINGSDLLT